MNGALSLSLSLSLSCLPGTQHGGVACADGGANRLFDALTVQERTESVRATSSTFATEEMSLYCRPCWECSLGGDFDVFYNVAILTLMGCVVQSVWCVLACLAAGLCCVLSEKVTYGLAARLAQVLICVILWLSYMYCTGVYIYVCDSCIVSRFVPRLICGDLDSIRPDVLSFYRSQVSN